MKNILIKFSGGCIEIRRDVLIRIDHVHDTIDVQTKGKYSERLVLFLNLDDVEWISMDDRRILDNKKTIQLGSDLDRLKHETAKLVRNGNKNRKIIEFIDINEL